MCGSAIPLETPLQFDGRIQHGFQRGRQLGFPTANVGVCCDSIGLEDGVYCGFSTSPKGIFPMVLSVGTNPCFGNDNKTYEVHILHEFQQDFYDFHLCVEVHFFIREQRREPSLDALKDSINADITYALELLSGVQPSCIR